MNKIDSNSYSMSYVKKVLLNIVEKQYQIINDSFKYSYEIQNAVKEKPMDLIKKLVIVFIGSVFLGLVLIFIIDYFKKNWKEIVNTK